MIRSRCDTSQGRSQVYGLLLRMRITCCQYGHFKDFRSTAIEFCCVYRAGHTGGNSSGCWCRAGLVGVMTDRPADSAPRPSTLFGAVLPQGPVAYEILGEGDPAVLLPEEEEVIASAVESRRRQFAAGRACTRAALADMGVESGPILPDPRRAPIWPEAVVGSITHCDGLAAAAVAPASDWLGVGIDAEPADPLPADIVRLIVQPSECAAHAQLSSSNMPWDRVIFSAKESVYKVWYPIRQEWLGFHDAVVHLEPGGIFTAQLTPPDIGRIPRQIQGRWAIGSGFIVTAVALPRLESS